MKNHAANKLINDVQGFEPKTLLIQELLIINILCVWGVCTCVCVVPYTDICIQVYSSTS